MVSYKEEHQRFMSGHTGTSSDQLAFLFCSAFIACALRDATLLWVGINHRLIRFLIDFIILVMPSLLNFTLLSNHVLLVLLCLSFMTVSLFVIFMNKNRPKSVSIHLSNTTLHQQKKFVTNYRSIVNLLTILAILAVDFQVFPRRFAKTEEFGFGLMDFGVGFFVVSNAIVSPEARGKENTSPRITQMKRAFVSSLPLLVLGFARLISVKGTDYQEHVTEYGVHWNFFFTLAALKISSTFVFCIVPFIKPGIVGCLLLFFHQFCLSNGLSAYIVLGADGRRGRSSLVDANREGIFSLPGYIALYMMSVQLGRFIFLKRSNLWDWLRAALYFCVIATGLTFLSNKVHFNVQLVSRRFVNAAYVLSTMSFSCIVLTVSLLGDIAKTFCISTASALSLQHEENSQSCDNDHLWKDGSEISKKKSRFVKDVCLLDAISLNSLLFFLLGNLMTGLVNMSMATIYASTTTAMLVLSLYSFLLCSVSVVLYSKDVKTKIW